MSDSCVLTNERHNENRIIDLLKITQAAVERLHNQPVLVATYCSSISIDSCRNTIRNYTNSIEGMLPASAVFF